MKDEEIELTEEGIVKRVLAENGLDAERALVVLLRTMVEDFLKARGGSGGSVGAGGNVMGKPNALDYLLHALMMQIERNRQMRERRADEGMENEKSISDGELVDGLRGGVGGFADVQGSLCEMAFECLRLAERELESREQETPKLHITE